MRKISNFIRNNYAILIIFLWFLATRIYNFSDIIWYETSSEILQIFQFITIKWQIFNLIPHFPLATILYKVWAVVAWNTIIWVKAMHIFLNILTFFLIYKTSILFYNDKKVANWSVLLYTISFYAYVWNTMWIDQDLATNPLFFILTLYLYKKYSDFSIRGIVLTVLACSLLTTSRPILWIIVMWIIFLDLISKYVVQNSKKVKFSWIMWEVIRFLKLFVPYLIVWWLVCYGMFKLFPSSIAQDLNIYKNLFNWAGWGGNLLTKLAFLGHVFMYASPLILSLFFLFKNYAKHQTILIASIVMILYMCMWLSWGDPARRMMPILPIFVIGRWYLCSKYINKREIIWIIVVAAIIIILNTTLLDYHNLPANISDYLSNIFNRVFLLESTVFNPIFLDTKLVFWIAWAALIFFLLFIFSTNNKLKSLFFVFSLWINIWLISIHLFQIKQPHISDISKRMYEFCAENCDWNQKIYADQVSKDTIMLWVREKNVWSYFNLHPENDIIWKTQSLWNNLIKLEGVNLFTQGMKQQDFTDIIKENWSGFAFLTNYFNNNEEIEILNKKCKIIEKFDWGVEEIYWIIYLCDF